MSILGMELLGRGFEPLEPLQFYREIFPDGELDEEDAMTPGSYTAIAVEITDQKRADGRPLVRRHTVTDSLDKIDELLWSEDFTILAPISYAGKSRESRNARYMYALVIELDDLIVRKGQQEGLDRLINQWSDRVHWIPRPTYTVASGNGLHLYYLFERPLPLFPNIVKELKAYKRELTEKIWNRHVTRSTGDSIQQESIFQGFRMVGSITKNGDRVTAYRTGEPVSLEYLNKYVSDKSQITVVYKSELTLAKAKEKYPEWYDRRIVNKQPKGSWATNRAVYDWWKERIRNEAIVGHRYYCLMMLVIYAIKCGNYHPEKNPYPVTREELEQDCVELMEILDERSDNPTNRFTEKDVADALQAYEDRGLYTYPVASISNRSGIQIEKNKRNGQKQADHLEEARAIRDIRMRRQNRDWRDGNGRPSAEQIVRDWVTRNPGKRKADCIRETGLDKKTVYKWWPKPDERPLVVDPDGLSGFVYDGYSYSWEKRN